MDTQAIDREIDRSLDALAREISEQQDGDEQAPISVHVHEAYDRLYVLLAKLRRHAE